MTREDVKKIFPEATSEQIDKILGNYNSDIAKEKTKNEKLKAENETVKEIEAEKAELQKKLDELTQGNLSEIEKATRAFEQLKKESEKTIADQQRQINEMKYAKELAEKGITGEQADSIIKSFMSGDFSSGFTAFSQIIADRESAAALAKEQEIANAQSNPSGDRGSKGDDKSLAMRMTEGLYANQAQSVSNNSVISSYL